MGREELIRNLKDSFVRPEKRKACDKRIPSEAEVASYRYINNIIEGQKKCERQERNLLFEG